ncbi:MAG: response regulator transcription factor [Bacilli bacterium]|nr:response regulator transcription factor [Bacilli bacterium]
MKVLIVDDEIRIRTVIKEYCINNNFETDEAENGEEALEKLLENQYDVLVLDIMMPEMDGFSMLKELPKEKRIPTIVLSARGEEYDKLTGFDLGIDDYVTKPFSPKELIARIKALINRSNKPIQETYEYNTLVINYLAHTVKIDNKLVNLTPKEYDVLTFLIKNKGIVISREQLLSNVWGYDFFGEDRTIDTHIKMLRNNLGKYRNHIITVRGIGYKYVEEEE